MSSLREINLFKLTEIISNGNTKISTIGEYNDLYEVLCLVQENNEIVMRRTDKFGKISLKLLCWFAESNRCIQDICFQPSGPQILVLCYDNTLHTVSLDILFEEITQANAQIITSYIVPFIGPHECPNSKTCPNNFESNTSNRSSISCRSNEDTSSYGEAGKKIDEMMKSSTTAMSSSIGNNVANTNNGTDSITNSIDREESDVEVISDKSFDNVELSSSAKHKLSKESTFDESKTYSTSLESSSYPCPYPTCCLWWQTLSQERRAIIGYSDGTICFVGLTPNCPFIANTSIEKSSIAKMVICKDSCLEIISLMITTSINEQWKLMLEQKAIQYCFPGDAVHFTIDLALNGKDKEVVKSQTTEIDDDWQFLINLIETNQSATVSDTAGTSTSTTTRPPSDSESTSSSASSTKSVVESEPVGLIPTARARLASLKDLGAKKIGALKMKLAESRMKNSEKLIKHKIEPTALAVIDSPGQYPEILTTPSGPFFSVQCINNKYLLTALHTYSDTLSVHSMDITLIPLFLYKIPKNCKTVLLTKNLLYTIQSIYNTEPQQPDENVADESVTESGGEKFDMPPDDQKSTNVSPVATTPTTLSTTDLSREVNVVSVISCRMASTKIDNDCEFNEKALLAQFSFPNERIINIHRQISIYDKDLINDIQNYNNEPTTKATDEDGGEFYYLKEYNNIRSKLEESENFDVTDVKVMSNKFPEVEYERCYIVTDRRVYSVDLSLYPHKQFLDFANGVQWSLCEDFCNTFNISLPQCIEFAGDVFLKRQKVTQALLTYNIAKIPPIYTAMKLAMFCECNALMHLCAMALKMTYIIKSKYPIGNHIKELLKTADKRIEMYAKCKIDIPKLVEKPVNSGRHCSDFSYDSDEANSDIKISNTSLFHLSNYLFLTLCERSIRDRQFLPLWNFLTTNTRYHSYLASVVLSESGLYSSAILLARTRGVALTVFYCLVKIAHTNPDEFFDLNVLMYNLSDEMFMECITYLYTIAQDYFEIVKKHIDTFNVELLERLKIQINPFNEVYRPIIVKISCLYAHGDEGCVYRKEYIDWYKSFIETYIIILIKLKSLRNPETNFLHGLDTFQIKYEEELNAADIDYAEKFGAGFSYGVCIVNRIPYMWGFNGIHPNFDVKSLDLDKSEPAHSPKELSFFTDLNLNTLSVKCGRAHFLLKTTSGLYAVGGNNLGQLGIGNHMSMSPHPSLVRAFEGKKIEMISVGQYHNGVVANGKLYTWGWGIFGQLGHGSIENVYTPRVVKFFNDKKIKQIACGYSHTLVLCEDSLYVFGSNHFGQLGLGQYVPSDLMYTVEEAYHGSLRTSLKRMLVPVKFDLDYDDEKIQLIHTHYFSNMVVTNKNNLYVWGLSPQSLRLASQAKKRAKQSQKVEEENRAQQQQMENQDNPMPPPPPTPPTVPNPVPKEVDEVKLSVAPEESDGGGDNNKSGDTEEEKETVVVVDDSCEHYFPKQVDTSDVEGDIVELSSGLYHYALMTSNRYLYTWGKNLERQLGHDSSRSDVSRPLKLETIENPLHVQCGGDFTLVMTTDYTIKAFGNNNSAQCGKEVSWKDYSGRLVRLRSSKRLVRIPDGSQYIQYPIDIQLPRHNADESETVTYLKNIPKYKKEYLRKSNLHETMLELAQCNNGTIDSNLNELCSETGDGDAGSDNGEAVGGDENPKKPNDECCITTADNSCSIAAPRNLSSLGDSNVDECISDAADLNELIHYCLYIFNGLYNENSIKVKLTATQIEYKIRILMLEYKFLEAFKLTINSSSISSSSSDSINNSCSINNDNNYNHMTPLKVIKIFEYFTKDAQIFPMPIENLKYFIYELFLTFITNKYSLIVLEEFLIQNLDVYLIHIAYVLFFNNNFTNNNNNLLTTTTTAVLAPANSNNNLSTTELERKVLEKYRYLFIENNFDDDKHRLKNGGEGCDIAMEKSDLIFRSVSSKFCIIICQKMIELNFEN